MTDAEIISKYEYKKDHIGDKVFLMNRLPFKEDYKVCDEEDMAPMAYHKCENYLLLPTIEGFYGLYNCVLHKIVDIHKDNDVTVYTLVQIVRDDLQQPPQPIIYTYRNDNKNRILMDWNTYTYFLDEITDENLKRLKD